VAVLLYELERELLSDYDDAFTVSALSPEQSSQLDCERVLQPYVSTIAVDNIPGHVLTVER